MRRAYFSLLVCSLFFGVATVQAQSELATGPNLVFNADFSQLNNVGDPLGWLRGGWGENTRSHTFTENGALEVTISSENYIDDYASGDAKWYFEDIIIGDGRDYIMKYDSAPNVVGAQVVARYTLGDGSFKYENVGTVPSDTTRSDPQYITAVHAFTAPDNAVSFTLFFLVRGDMVCYTACGLGNKLFVKNVDVRVLSKEESEEVEETTEEEGGEAAEEENTATTTPESGTASGGGTIGGTNLVVNGSMEESDGRFVPVGWLVGRWGQNDGGWRYAESAFEGERALRVELDAYVSGDSKWYFEDIDVEGGGEFTYKEYYRASVPTELGLYYQTSVGPQYQYIGWLPQANEWTEVERAFTVPAEATSFTVMHYIYSNGWLEIDDVSVTSDNTESTTDGSGSAGGSNAGGGVDDVVEEETETSTTTDPYEPTPEWEDVTLSVQVRTPDHASTRLTPVPVTGEYSIGRLEMIAEESDVVAYSTVAVRIETPGAYPTDVIEDITFIDLPLQIDRPHGTFVPERSSLGSGYYEFTLPEAIYVTEGTPEVFTVGAIFTEDFAHNQIVQLVIADEEMADWDALSAAYNTKVINLEADYAGPIYTLQQVNPPANSGSELFALVDSLLTQIVETDIDLTLDMQITQLMLQIEARELRDRGSVSAEEVQQFISKLLAFIAALEDVQTEESTSVCPYTWTRDLSIGVEGADVFKLQQFLNENTDTRVAISGPGSMGNETDTYDEATAAAVAKFQVFYRSDILTPQGLVNPTGEFDPSTRSKANQLCLPDDMMEEDVDELTGEASLDFFNLAPAYDNGGEVELGDNDEVIGELQLEFTDGDAEIARIDLAVGSIGGANPWDVFEELSLWVEGDLIDISDADDVDDYLDDMTGMLRFSNLDIVALEEETLSIVIAASIKRDIPSTALTDWQLYIESVRFFDADGVATTQTELRNVSFDSDVVTFEIVESPVPAITIGTSFNDPDASALLVNDDDESDEYTIGVFEIESEADNLEIETLAVRIDTPGGITEDIIDDIQLVIEGEEFYYDDIISAGTSSAYITFDIDGDVFLDEDEAVEVEVLVTFEGADEYLTPQNVQVSLGGEALVYWEAENQYDDLLVEDIEGTYTGEVHTLLVAGLVADANSIETQVYTAGENGTTGYFEIEFEVTAIDADFYFTDVATADAATEGLTFTINDPVFAGEVSATLTSSADEDTLGVFTVGEGETETITLTAVLEPTFTGPYRVTLDTLYFSTDTDGTSDIQSLILTPAVDYRTQTLTVVGS